MWPAVAIARRGALAVALACARPRRAERRAWPLALAIVPLVGALAARARDRARAQRAGRAGASGACRRDAATTALRYARLHWQFFERFVTAETHWLAPDNFQEDPAPVVAMRTSPTNIGLQLLVHGERARPRLHHRSRR